MPSDFAINNNLGAIIEYGAVEIYSGYSSIESNYIISLYGSEFVYDAVSIPNKLQLRVLGKAKEVYIACGLLDTWTVINNVLTLLGQEPLPRPNYADWSFRRDILPTIELQPDYYGLWAESPPRVRSEALEHDRSPCP